ncbi:MAG TPA: trypsin-like peptidase domain-containing protein [Anaeromyxobacteraceae bacterium]|nr:trypsin-like peptidase domain-containing protein [Anaeromyxobacteraceae bacterium]
MSALAELSRDLARRVAEAAPSVVGVELRRGQGSGLVLAPDGYVLTNAHVAAGRGELALRLPGGQTAPGERVGADPRTDLAVIRAARGGLRALPLDESRRLEVGEIVLAIGNPLGFERSVSLGVVSALHRNLPTRDGVIDGLIQTDAAVNPGNSGGPLLDAEGRVVGVTTAMLPWAHGMAFAVPARTAGWVAAVLMREGRVRRPFLGIQVRGEELPDELARAAGQPRALRVLGVEGGAPADAAGVRTGDLVVSANGAAVVGLDDLSRAMVLAAPREVALGVLRDGAPRTLAVRPGPERRAA